MDIVYNILYEKNVIKTDIPKLSNENKLRLKNTILNKLVLKPLTFGKPLRRSLSGYRSLRAEDFRVVFKIQDSNIKILAIIKRSEIYKIALKRINK